MLRQMGDMPTGEISGHKIRVKKHMWRMNPEGSGGCLLNMPRPQGASASSAAFSATAQIRAAPF